MCDISSWRKMSPSTNICHSPFNTCQRPKYVWNSSGPVSVHVSSPVKVSTLPWFSCHLSSITANPVIWRLSLQIQSFDVYHCRSCHLTSITANPVIWRLSLQNRHLSSYHCKSCHLTSITASQCFFCLSRPILFRLDFPVHNHFFCPFPNVPRPVVFFCPVLSFPVFLSFLSFLSPPPPLLSRPPETKYPTDLISDNLQCLNDGDVSQLLGDAQGRLSILQKKDKKYGEISEKMSRSPGLGIRISLIKK